jgi:hypothetical protein
MPSKRGGVGREELGLVIISVTFEVMGFPKKGAERTAQNGSVLLAGSQSPFVNLLVVKICLY